MNIKNISELPELKGFDLNTTALILQNLKHDREILENSNVSILFKEFWLICDCPIPIVFKYKGRYYITRDTSRFREVKNGMSEKKMAFADITALPKTNRGKQGKDYLAVLQKIPVGKMWIPEKDEVNASTIRKAIKELEEAKKVKKGEFEATQRTIDDVVKVYVLHNEVK